MAEIWDLYDKDGNKTDKTWERTHGNYLNIPEGYYHLVCDILIRNSDGSYLLTRRHPGKDVYPGFWEASCGGSAVSGEVSEECARREMFEETGIRGEDLQFINKTIRDHSHSIIYSYIADVDVPADSVVLQEGETTDYKWVDAKGLIDYSESETAIKTHVDRYRAFFDKLKDEING
ncbi:NUDIX domain-containing protein [Ruminococcaceae bacterium KH2T8]|nr:NUDIX domain-containing protein [Ruminococcaceae bacterium KH2T8]